VLLSVTSCGRRGDPFLPPPHDVAEEKENIVIKERDKADDLSKGTGDVEIIKPDAPSGLFGIFTGTTVVLTWSEITGQGVESYRVYRIGNDGYEKAGETVIPAFIDEEIKMKSSYRYKVTSVGKTESDFSNEIEIITEDKQ
jgi:fibronectin type 3 domain-containing protein